MNIPYEIPGARGEQAALKNKSAIVPSWAVSPEVWVMFRPAAAYQWLAESPACEHKWRALKRPIFVALLIGCMVSLVVSQRLTLRHVAGGALNASFLLLGQIAALAIVCGRERRFSFSRIVDLFFVGYGPWTLWILAFSASWAFLTTQRAFVFAGPGSMLPTAAMVTLWSSYINYRFFERVLQRSRARAVWDAFRLWAICWCICIVIFGWGALWSEHMRMIGR